MRKNWNTENGSATSETGMKGGRKWVYPEDCCFSWSEEWSRTGLDVGSRIKLLYRCYLRGEGTGCTDWQHQRWRTLWQLDRRVLEWMECQGVGIHSSRPYFDVLNQLDLYPKEAVNGTELLFVNFGEGNCLLFACFGQNAWCRCTCRDLSWFSQDEEADGACKWQTDPFVAIVGENEMAEGKLTLKNMTTGEQSLLTSDELLKQ